MPANSSKMHRVLESSSRQSLQSITKKNSKPVHNVTPFQNRVYKATKAIPKGTITTYAEMAKFLNCKSSQAIGQALKRNPFAPQVPCHRIISSTLTIGGFFGETSGSQIEKKLKLLEDEGVKFKDGKLISEKIFRFEGLSEDSLPDLLECQGKETA